MAISVKLQQWPKPSSNHALTANKLCQMPFTILMLSHSKPSAKLNRHGLSTLKWKWIVLTARCAKVGSNKGKYSQSQPKKQFKRPWWQKMKMLCQAQTKRVLKCSKWVQCQRLTPQATNLRRRVRKACVTLPHFMTGEHFTNKWLKQVAWTTLEIPILIGVSSKWICKQGALKTCERSMLRWTWQWDKWASTKKSNSWTSVC